MFAKMPRATAVAQKPKRKTRPVFDESEIGQVFKLYFETRQKPLEPISGIILKTLFGNVNFRAVADEIFQNVKNSKAVCAKIFTLKDIAFKCFDCEKDPTCIICKECYEKGNHKGHRVQVQKSVSGCCDCGDPDAWNEDGFCSEHPGYANFKPTYSVEDIPENFRESFITVFEKCFFFLFHFYEEYAITKKADQAMELEINDLTTHILSALFFCGERSMALWLLLCQLFRTKLSERNRELYANTENLKETAFHDVPKVCDFTYFETWLYYHSLNHPNIQKKIEEICIKLFADYQFKIYLAESYIKMIYFIFPLWTPPDPQQPAPVYIQSRITGLNVQLFTAEEFAIIGINSPHFPAFLDLFRDILSWTTKNSSMNSFETVMEFYSFFHFASQKQPSRKRLVESGVFITRILDWLDLMNDCFRLNTVNKPSLNPQDIENTALLMDIEYKLLQIVDSIFAELNALEDQQFKARQIEEITEMFVNRIKKNDIETFKNRENHDKYRSLSIPFYRAFGLYIKNLLEEPTIAALERLVKETMKISDRNMEIIVHFLFKTTLRTVTFPIDNEKKAWEFHSPLFDLFSSMYRNPKLKFLDCDIIVLQISLVFIHAEDFCLALQSSASANPMFRKIFGPLHTGKFNTEKFQELIPDLHKALENSPEKQEKRTAPALKLFKKEETQPIEYRIDTLLDEFFNILIMLCTDGVAFANLFHQKNKMFEEVKHPAFCKSVYTDVIINVFQKQNKMAYKTLKEILSNRIINEKADIETSLNEVATFNSTTKTFIIKDKYTEIYEPFTFIRDPQLLVETHESIQARLKTNKLVNDLVIGQSSYIYEYKHSIPNRIQENVFSFPIVEFAVDCLIQSKEMSKSSSLINRPVLKFLHMALNFALHFKNEKLIQKMAPISENKLFTERLKELKADPTCPAVSPAIDAIMQLLGQIQKLCSIQGVEPMEVVAEGDTDKHNKQLEANKTRMQAIKAQFSQKREAFLKKFKTEIEDDTATEEELLCCICRSKMTDETEYGIPAFFGESSLYNLAFCKSKNKLQEQAIQEEEETKVDLTNLQNLPKEAFKPYPVVTSCSHSLHYIHKECFEKHSRARTGSNVGFVYGNDLEYSCSLCKSLCNVFIPKKTSKAIMDQDKVEGIEVELANVKDLVEYIETVNAVPHNSGVQPDSLFNDIMLLEVINDNICKRLSQNVANEDFIIDKFDNLFGQCCQTVTFGGLQYFIKHKYSVYKPLVEAYRQFYVSHNSQTKGAYYDKQKILLSKYLQLLLFGLPQAIQTDDDALLFRDAASTKIPLLATPDEFIFQSLQHILIASKLSTKMASELTSKIMRVYLVHRMVQVYIKDKLQKGGSEEISYENFIKDLSLSNNSPIKEEVTNGLLPSVRKVVVFILLNSNIEEAALAGLTKDFTNDEQEINQYLMIKGLETTIADLLSPKAFEYAGIPEESIKNWIGTAKAEFKGFNSLTPYVKMVDRDVVFSFTELPENYYDLSTTYIEKKCQMCKDHPQMGNRCVCLLCDMVLCSIVCTKKQIQRNQELGNLNTHSMMHHAGECAFLNVETGRIYLLKTPKNVDYCPLYVDRFGYGLQEEKARDWRSYKLDKACLDNLREKFVYEKVAQEVSYNITNNSKKLYDSLL